MTPQMIEAAYRTTNNYHLVENIIKLARTLGNDTLMPEVREAWELELKCAKGVLMERLKIK